MQLPGLNETMQCRLPRVSVAKRTVLQRFAFQILQNLPAKLHANGKVYGKVGLKVLTYRATKK